MDENLGFMVVMGRMPIQDFCGARFACDQDPEWLPQKFVF
jgi:hypothetical protein